MDELLAKIKKMEALLEAGGGDGLHQLCHSHIRRDLLRDWGDPNAYLGVTTPRTTRGRSESFSRPWAWPALTT